MAFATFPAAGYLSNAVRIESEMKTALEDWLAATKQVGGHGQGQVLTASPTLLYLLPWGGRRFIVGNRPYLLPPGGLALTNGGLGANSAYHICLYDAVPDGNVILTMVPIIGANLRWTDPDSGISVMSFNGGASVDLRYVVVGTVYTDNSGQFGPGRVCSLFNRRFAPVHTISTGQVTTGTVTDLFYIGAAVPAFAYDSFHVTYRLIVTAGATGATVAVKAFRNSIDQGYSTTASVPANLTVPVDLDWVPPLDGNDQPWYFELRVNVQGGPVTLQPGSSVTVDRLA